MKTRKASQGITLLCVSGPIPVLIQRRWQEKARTHPTSKCFFCWVSAAPAPQPPRNKQRRQTAAGRKGCPYHRSRTDRRMDGHGAPRTLPGGGHRRSGPRLPLPGRPQPPPRAASQGGGGAEEASPRPRRLRAGSEGGARLGAPAKGPCPAPCTQSQAQAPPRQPTRRSNRVRAHHLHVKLPTSIKSLSN